MKIKGDFKFLPLLVSSLPWQVTNSKIMLSSHELKLVEMNAGNNGL
jgi:hypothetical protein